MEHEPIISVSGAMQRALDLVGRFATTDLSVLIVGPTGCGKELLAREVHRRGKRGGAFVDVNCAALPHELVEGELFGHRRGSFTGAVADTIGLIRAADGGTLF